MKISLISDEEMAKQGRYDCRGFPQDYSVASLSGSLVYKVKGCFILANCRFIQQHLSIFY